MFKIKEIKKTKIDYIKINNNLEILKNFLALTASFTRKILSLPSIKVRTRSKKKNFQNNSLTIFKDYTFPFETKYVQAETYNIIWFVFFSYEWYITFKYNNILKKKNHWKNIHFSHKDLKYKKVVCQDASNKEKKKKMKNKKEFNIGFYYKDTFKLFRNYLKFRQ